MGDYHGNHAAHFHPQAPCAKHSTACGVPCTPVLPPRPAWPRLEEKPPCTVRARSTRSRELVRARTKAAALGFVLTRASVTDPMGTRQRTRFVCARIIQEDNAEALLDRCNIISCVVSTGSSWKLCTTVMKVCLKISTPAKCASHELGGEKSFVKHRRRNLPPRNKPILLLM